MHTGQTRSSTSGLRTASGVINCTRSIWDRMSLRHDKFISLLCLTENKKILPVYVRGRIIRVSNRRHILQDTGNCALSAAGTRQKTNVNDADNGSSGSSSSDAGRRRRRRWKRSHSRERHVEALVAVDVEMRRYHGHNLEHYILTLMAIVNI